MPIGDFKATEFRSNRSKTPNSIFSSSFFFPWLFSLLRSSRQSLSVDVKVNRILLMLVIITIVFFWYLFVNFVPQLNFGSPVAKMIVKVINYAFGTSIPTLLNCYHLIIKKKNDEHLVT